MPNRPERLPRLALVQASAKALRSEGEQRVSVALCTYNGERFIEQQLASILSQSRPVDEIVVSDDGSTDGTVEIVRRVVSGNSRPGLKILQNSSALGVTANFEQAMAACTGEFICLSDQDDIWMPDRVELALEKFRERPELQLVHSNAELVDEQSDSLGEDLFRAIGFSRLERKRIRKGQALRVLLRRNVVTGATVMLRRELFEQSRPFPASWVHDEWLAVNAGSCGQIDFLDQRLINYRQHESNQIGAGSLGLGKRLGKLAEGRRSRNERLFSRAKSLAERFEAEPEKHSEVGRRLSAQKFEHESFRSDLPANRFLRVLPVIAEFLRGRYSRFGRARFDVPRDLLQPDN